MRKHFDVFLLILLLHPSLTCGDCSCDKEGLDIKHSRSISLKLLAIFSILTAGAAGISIPTLGKWIPALRPEKDIFFTIKAFAAGVILATGFIHILPHAFENLTSPCLNPTPWQDFPFAGFFAMVAAIGTLIVDISASGYFNRIRRLQQQNLIVPDVENDDKSDGSDIHASPQADHGHAHGASQSSGEGWEIRHKVISQAKFKIKSLITMFMFFSLTTPIGISVCIGMSSSYSESSHAALIVEGILSSAAAGILIYMALVDLLAADFMNLKVQNNVKLQITNSIVLLLGAGFMSLLAKWA